MKDLKHQESPLPKRRTSRAVLVAVVMIFSLTAGMKSTFAWLIDEEKPLQNTFEPVQVSCQIEEQFENNEKQAVKVKNTGEADAYIRIAVSSNYIDESGAIIEPANAALSLNKTWFKAADGFYYYQNAVKAGEFTDILFEGSITNDEGLQMVVLAEALQAQGAEDAVPAVQKVWSAVMVGENGRLTAAQEVKI